MQDQPTIQQPQLSRGEQYAGPAGQTAVDRQPPAVQQHSQGQVAQQPQQFAGAQPAQQSAMELQAQPQFPAGEPQQQQAPSRQSPQPVQQSPQPAESIHALQQAGVSQPNQQQPTLQQGQPQTQLQPTIQQPEVRRQAAVDQQPQFQQQQPQSQFQPVGAVTQPTVARQPSVAGSVGQQTGVQPQQIPVESSADQGQITGGQQAGGVASMQSKVETADTKLLADVLARRLGLTSRQLAQVVPQLGVALGDQQYGAQQPIGREPVGQQPIGQQGSMGVQQPQPQQQLPAAAAAGQLQSPVGQQR